VTVRFKRRGSQRGAAMVEGIVVIMTMLTFLGMNLWAVKAFGGKLDQATAVRRDVMFYATHNCEKNNEEDPDSYQDPALKGISEASGKGGFVQDVVAIVQTVAATKGGTEAGLGNATRGGTTLYGSALVGMHADKTMLRTTMTTAATVACNEKAIYSESKFVTLFKAGLGFFKGILALVKGG